MTSKKGRQVFSSDITVILILFMFVAYRRPCFEVKEKQHIVSITQPNGRLAPINDTLREIYDNYA